MYTEEYIPTNTPPVTGDFIRRKAKGHLEWVDEGEVRICVSPEDIDLDVWETVEVVDKF